MMCIVGSFVLGYGRGYFVSHGFVCVCRGSLSRCGMYGEAPLVVCELLFLLGVGEGVGYLALVSSSPNVCIGGVLCRDRDCCGVCAAGACGIRGACRCSAFGAVD